MTPLVSASKFNPVSNIEAVELGPWQAWNDTKRWHCLEDVQMSGMKRCPVDNRPEDESPNSRWLKRTRVFFALRLRGYKFSFVMPDFFMLK